MSAGAQAAAEPCRDATIDVVAERVPVSVVDRLQVVEVDEQHRDHLPLAPLAREGVLDAVVEERAVGELGQRVVERAVAQLLLEAACARRRREG